MGVSLRGIGLENIKLFILIKFIKTIKNDFYKMRKLHVQKSFREGDVVNKIGKLKDFFLDFFGDFLF